MCESYAQLIQSIPTLTNKKRKEAERSLESMIVEYKFIKDDSTSVIKWKESENNLYNNQQYLENIQTHVKQKIDKLCHILENRGFIIKDETDNYSLTYHLGKVAASIAEINSVVFSELMKKTHNFEKFSSKQLIGLFSCFTDIKIKEEVKLSVPNTEDILLMSNIIELKQIFKQYESLEDEYNLNSGFDYENALTYDIVDEVIKWCDCENEKDCKYFIFNSLGEKDIAIGDFSKAILKINTISKELMTICEQNDIIDLMHKLSKIDGMILKYITTTQSLYV